MPSLKDRVGTVVGDPIDRLALPGGDIGMGADGEIQDSPALLGIHGHSFSLLLETLFEEIITQVVSLSQGFSPDF